MDNDFTFRNPRICKWLALVAVATVVLSYLRPPSFWLCGVGGVLVIVGQFTNSARTNQWMSWQHEGSLDWFEGWAVSTGAVMAIIPLVGAIIRSVLS